VAETRCIFAARRLVFLQSPQPVFEIAGIDGTQKGFDHLRRCEPLARSDGAAPNRAAGHFYCGQDVVRAADRRQREFDRPFAARRHGRIAGLALGEPPAPISRSLFPLFYLVEIRHRSISFAHPAPPSALPERHETPTLWQFSVVADKTMMGLAVPGLLPHIHVFSSVAVNA
jgi:hypothetical protein